MAANSYTLLDSGKFRKLEQLGPYRVSRPAASAVWDPALNDSEWKNVDAEFQRFKDGTGEWKIRNEELRQPFAIEIHGITFQMKLTSFGHLGIFPEQLSNWLKLEELTKARVSKTDKVRVLNLFAYTGGSSLFCARGGAEVSHVDASKGTVKWASENAKLSGLDEKPIRWLVDDVKEFVARDLRRDSKYDGIILDPPSYGKGEKKQVWKIETDLLPLLRDLKKLLKDESGCFVCLSAHSEGYTPVSLTNQLVSVFGKGQTSAQEMLVEEKNGRSLPSGAGAILVKV